MCCFQAFSPNWPSTIVLSVFYEIMSILILTNSTNAQLLQTIHRVLIYGGGGGGTSSDLAAKL